MALFTPVINTSLALDAWGGTAPTPQLATPAGFAAGTPTASTVPLSWSAVPNATGYVVQRATNANFTGLTTIYTGPNTSVTNSSGLSPATGYYYRVYATASGYTNSTYAALSVSTAAGGTAPATGYTTTDYTSTDYVF